MSRIRQYLTDIVGSDHVPMGIREVKNITDVLLIAGGGGSQCLVLVMRESKIPSPEKTQGKANSSIILSAMTHAACV